MDCELLFHLLEIFAFILPALPESIYTRLFILCLYFIGHFFKAQIVYVKYKKQFLDYCNGNLEEKKISELSKNE